MEHELLDPAAADSPDGYTAEDYLDLLRSNVLALAAGTIAYLQSRGIAVGDWTRTLGEIFARGWDTAEPWSPDGFLEATVINLAAFGGEAIQSEYSDDESWALISGFPDRDRLAGLGLDKVEPDLLYDLIEPIAAACGVRYAWRREGDQVRITVTQR